MPAMQPWDKAKLADAAPWEKARLQEEMAQKNVPIKEEMPEGVSDLDRFKVMNLSNDPKAAVDYLQNKYPDYQVFERGGRILFQKPDEKIARPLAPQVTLSDITKNPGNILHRSTDFVAPFAAGVGSTIAAGGAAAAAFPETLGIGSLPAAALAGGATSAGLEAFRQKLGKELGVNKEIKPGEVATEGVAGAAAPVLFGAKGAQGLIGKGYDTITKKVLPKVGEWASGVPANTIRNAADNMGKIKDLEKNGVTDFAEQAQQDISGNLQKAKQFVGKNIENAIEGAGGAVDVQPVVKPFQDLLAKLKKQQSELNTPALAEKIGDVENKLKYFFTKQAAEDAEPQVIQSVSPSTAFSLKQDLADLGSLDKVRDTGVKSSLAGMSPAQKEIASAAREAKSNLDKGIETSVNQAADTLGMDENGFSSLKQQYRDLNNIQNTLEPKFNSTEKTYNTLKGLAGKNKQVLMETMQGIDDKYGTNAMENAKLLDAYNYFHNPSFNPISANGSTSTSRSIPLAGLGSAAGYYLGHKVGMGIPGAVAGGIAGGTVASPYALRGYMAVGRGIRGTTQTLGQANAALPLSGANIYSQQNPDLQLPWTLFPDQTKGGSQ